MKVARGIEEQIEPIAHGFGTGCGLRPENTQTQLLAAIKEEFGAGAAGAKGRANGLDALPIESGKYALDMLAGTTR